MKRDITVELSAWKTRTRRKPLIIRGARQVGKTYSITEIGKSEFKFFVKIDFEKQIQARKIFEGDLSPSRLIPLIELETGIDISIGDTLLFFDEIQLCPQALVSLRYFYEECPDLHVVAAGSLLEFEMERISFPVGRVEFLYMHPLTFGEFLINQGKERLDAMRPKLADTDPIEETVHALLMDALRTFFMVGGMPEAVQSYIETNSFNEVRRVHESLVNSLIQDLLKYEKHLENDLVREIIETVSHHVGSAIKYSGLSPTASHYKIKQALKTLEKALLVSPVHSSSGGLPLGGNLNKSAFKLCLSDIGMMQQLCGIPAGEIMQSDDLMATYKGALCEQFIGQELAAAGGSQSNRLFYWSRAAKSSNAEVDYLLVRDGKTIPIEVKNGPAGRLKSLHRYLLEHPGSTGIVLNSGNIGTVDHIRFMPLYTKLPKLNA